LDPSQPTDRPGANSASPPSLDGIGDEARRNATPRSGVRHRRSARGLTVRTIGAFSDRRTGANGRRPDNRGRSRSRPLLGAEGSTGYDRPPEHIAGYGRPFASYRCVRSLDVCDEFDETLNYCLADVAPPDRARQYPDGRDESCSADGDVELRQVTKVVEAELP